MGPEPLVPDLFAAHENAPVGVAFTAISGPDFGRIVRANTALCRMLGYDQVELVDLRQVVSGVRDLLGPTIGADVALEIELPRIRSRWWRTFTSSSRCSSTWP